MRTINNSKFKKKGIFIEQYLLGLCDKYGYYPKTLLIETSKFYRGFVNGNMICICPSKWETSRSYKWVIAHEYAHFLCKNIRALHKYVSSSPSDLNDVNEEAFCSGFACMEANGLYDRNWYLKRCQK